MPRPVLRIAEEFSIGLSHIYSEKLLQRIRSTLELLPALPEMGSPNVRQSLIDRYGINVRMIPVSTFVIVYRYENDAIDVLALVCGPTIR